ncbi:MAG TPA: cell division protein ZapD [Candidatus Competibacteraceae bacterium]|nr:cell division protein ZapD [Candidatus Competibacteraceae bacterium]
MTRTVCYEQPLNERVRILLRLEFLFHQIDHALAGHSQWDSRAALQGLFDILSLTARNELKSELLKELDRHSSSLHRLRQIAEVDTQALERIQEEIAQVSRRVHSVNVQSLEAVRQNEFLNAIRQRSSIPGGTCRFDLPLLHHWLQRDSSQRQADLENWLRPLQPLAEGVETILKLIRTSATPQEEIALQGFFQKALDSSAPSQMVRVILPVELGLFAEISGGRHRFSIRFLSQPSPDRRAVPVKDDISFQLCCCII